MIQSSPYNKRILGGQAGTSRSSAARVAGAPRFRTKYLVSGWTLVKNRDLVEKNILCYSVTEKMILIVGNTVTKKTTLL